MIYKNIKDFEKALYEGLISTHNITTSVQILSNWYEVMTKNFNIIILDNDTFKIEIEDKITTSLFEILIKDINNLGYFPSLIYLKNEQNMTNRFKYDFDKINNIIMSKNIIGIILICEKKFDNIVEISNVIYHVCKEQNIQKILKIGLCPKRKSRISDHPERIYFCLNIQTCNDLINRFKKNDLLNNLPEQKYKILEIDTSKLKDVVFRNDPNLNKYGVYTYDNIPKLYIQLKNNKQ